MNQWFTGAIMSPVLWIIGFSVNSHTFYSLGLKSKKENKFLSKGENFMWSYHGMIITKQTSRIFSDAYLYNKRM